jgi:hypothetical protein
LELFEDRHHGLGKIESMNPLMPVMDLDSGLNLDLKLLTYNVQCYPWLPLWSKEIVAWITTQSGANLVAIQGLWSHHGEWSAAFAARGWNLLRPARESHITTMGGVGSGLAFAFPIGQWVLRDARYYPFLASSGLDTLVAKGWFQLELSGVCRIINTDMQEDLNWLQRFTIVKTHVDMVRRQQARQLMATLERFSVAPTLIVGTMHTEVCPFPGWGFVGVDSESGSCGNHLALPLASSLVSCKSHRVFNLETGWSEHRPVSFEVFL